MAVFIHSYGYTLFAKAHLVDGRWVAVVDTVEGAGVVYCHRTTGDHETRDAALLDATVEAINIAKALGAVS